MLAFCCAVAELSVEMVALLCACFYSCQSPHHQHRHLRLIHLLTHLPLHAHICYLVHALHVFVCTVQIEQAGLAETAVVDRDQLDLQRSKCMQQASFLCET